jgi:hypothetical protein
VEINTSLIAQVRQLQAVVSERDEALKVANLEKSRLEAEAEGFAQRLKSMDESEQRYKDENWNLETQTHEMIAAAKEATSREQKLQQLLAIATAEKSAVERDLDDLKQNHGRLMEDLTVIRKNHDVEIAGLRKNIHLGDTEKGALQRKVEELTTQNQEFAKALTARFRDAEAEPGKDVDSEPEDLAMDRSEPEHSPPPSPTKGVPRHAMLESETLKSSLHHAHRMIQNLKGNIHREKTEKSDLKRMLQEARDELEVRKRDPGGTNHESKKSRFKPQYELNKKARPTMLGAGRESKVNIMADDAEWEEQNGERSPFRNEGVTGPLPKNGAGLGQMTDMSDAYQTANETEDSFETANELESATENDSYQPGVKDSVVESSDELTETEEGPARGRVILGGRRSPLVTGKPGDRLSYRSTASTSGDDDEQSIRTPVQQPQKYRLKVHRGPRRSRMGSEPLGSSTPPSAKNSPASFVGGGGQEGQSLFAELEDLNQGESGEDVDGTPTKRSALLSGSTSSLSSRFSQEQLTSSQGRESSSNRPTSRIAPSPEGPENSQLPRPLLVDSGTMTDPWEPVQGSLDQPGDKRPESASADDPFVSRPPNTERGFRQAQDSGFVGGSTTPSGLQKILDRPLGMLSNILPSFRNASESTLSTKKLREVHNPETSEELASDIQTRKKPGNNQHLKNLEMVRQSPTANSSTSTVTKIPEVSISSIQSLEIPPSVSCRKGPIRDLDEWITSPAVPAITLNANSISPSKPNVERIISSIFGHDTSDTTLASHPGETETGREVPRLPERDARRPFQELTSSIVGQPKMEDIQDTHKPVLADVADQSSQTILSSEQIDRILLIKEKSLSLNIQKGISAPIMKPLSDIGADSPPSLSQRPFESKDTNKGKQPEQPHRDPTSSVKVPRRPLSSTSIRSRSGQYPPLPPDHQQAIAAAAQKAPSIEPPVGSMGPPLAPASAYRTSMTRPRTPSRSRTQSQQQMQNSASRNGTTPRARNSTSKSQISRRSSVSSFASELDERFNIRVNGLPGPYGAQSGTDPRMIQAITQTMIGEFLWKYTRKAGRGDMSSNRHRRFFWVHPYTRTLYWSDKDPSTAGRAELKAKSVGIEAVQVVIDDNPMPPGLHRKSLVIFTPGRCIKLTATTGQRHETWFNALSYLLLRTSPEGAESAADDTNITSEEIEEFNPTLSRHPSRTIGSRISLASFRNNPSQRSLKHHAQPTLEVRQSQNAPRAAHSSVPSRHSHQYSSYQGSASSRWSQYLKHGTSIQGSVSSRTSRSVPPHGRSSSQYTNTAHDSAEDLRQVIQQQEREADQLENVRACCDGRFFLSLTVPLVSKPGQ